MELKIKEITFPEVIEFNFDELKQEITDRVEMYRNLVYTEDQVKQAKTDRANLRKFVDALSAERIKVKKQCLQPYEAFEAKVNELAKIVQEPINMIDEQVKDYENKQKQAKQDEILKYWESAVDAGNVPKFLLFEKIFNDKWLNASVSMKSIQDEINARLEQIATDIATLSNLPEFGFEAVEVYKTTLDMNRAIAEAQRMSQIAKAKAEAEAKKQEEAIPGQMKLEDVMNPPVTEAPAKQWISFSALLSTEDALALRDFFNSRQIQFKAV